MKQNVGIVDRVIRIILGVALILCGFFIPAVGWWGVLGLIPLVTGIIGYCGLYSIFKISTKK